MNVNIRTVPFDEDAAKGPDRSLSLLISLPEGCSRGSLAWEERKYECFMQ